MLLPVLLPVVLGGGDGLRVDVHLLGSRAGGRPRNPRSPTFTFFLGYPLIVRTASSHSWWLPRSPAFPVEYPIFVRDQPLLSRRRPPASRSLFSGSHTAQSGTGFFPLGLAMVVAAVRGEEVVAVRVHELVRLLRGVDGVQGPQQPLLVSQELVNQDSNVLV